MNKTLLSIILNDGWIPVVEADFIDYGESYLGGYLNGDFWVTQLVYLEQELVNEAGFAVPVTHVKRIESDVSEQFDKIITSQKIAKDFSNDFAPVVNELLIKSAQNSSASEAMLYARAAEHAANAIEIMIANIFAVE